MSRGDGQALLAFFVANVGTRLCLNFGDRKKLDLGITATMCGSAEFQGPN